MHDVMCASSPMSLATVPFDLLKARAPAEKNALRTCFPKRVATAREDTSRASCVPYTFLLLAANFFRMRHRIPPGGPIAVFATKENLPRQRNEFRSIDRSRQGNPSPNVRLRRREKPREIRFLTKGTFASFPPSELSSQSKQKHRGGGVNVPPPLSVNANPFSFSRARLPPSLPLARALTLQVRIGDRIERSVEFRRRTAFERVKTEVGHSLYATAALPLRGSLS